MILRIFCLLCPLLLLACVEDPPVPVTGEAYIRSQFIPADSVNKLELRQALNEGLIIRVIDELDLIDSLIAAGDPGNFTEELETLNGRLDSLEEINSSLTSTIRRLSGGTIQLDFLTANGSDEEIRYPFPQEFYGLPLTNSLNEVTFIIGYGSYQEEATISYQLETLFEERVLRRRGYSLDLAAYSFDSVKVQCIADTCTTDEILYTFYF